VAKSPPPDYGKLKNLSFAIIGLLSLTVVGGIALFVQINDVRNDLATAQKELSKKLENLELAVEELGDGQTTAKGALSRIERRLAESQVVPALALTGDQIDFLHEALKFNPYQIYKGVGRTGDILPYTTLYEYPSGVTDQISSLKGTRYTFDMKEQILIVSAADRGIIAVVSA